MRTINKQIKFGGKNNQKLYYEQFSSYDEYWKVVEYREKTNAHDRDSDLNHICDNASWVGCKSYDEAKNLLINGWDENIEYFKKQLSKEVELCDEKKITRTFVDVVGFMPVVANAVMNLPNCMLNQKVDKKKAKVIKFLILMNRSCQYSSKDILDKMSKVLARISVLEKRGYRCRIELFGSFHDGKYDGKTIVAHSVLLKSESQLFDMKRMAFPIAHSAMQRVFGFAWENSLPIDYDSYHECGLGRSIQYWNTNCKEDLLNAINENNEKIIEVGMESDLDKLFGKVVS